MNKDNTSLSVRCLALSALLMPLAAFAYSGSEPVTDTPYNNWLRSEFSAQHQRLIPVVAVADMYFACNKQRKTHSHSYSVAELVQKVDREVLAEKLTTCLGEDSVKSDAAINFGLTACFQEQLAHLSVEEKKDKMAVVQQAILSLPRDERQKSFTQCVTEQAISYLK